MITRLQQQLENRLVTLLKNVQQIFCKTSTCKPLLQGKKWEPGVSFQEHVETTVLWKSCPLSSASMLDSWAQKQHRRAICFLWLHSHIHGMWQILPSANSIRYPHLLWEALFWYKGRKQALLPTPEAQFPECLWWKLAQSLWITH